MDQKTGRRAKAETPESAARFVRRSAQAICEGSGGVSQYRAEYQALVEWATMHDRLLASSYIERFSYVGEGAEHRVYHDFAGSGLAVKATRSNSFGYSTSHPSHWASPVEYLKRLAWQNSLFGDDIRLIGTAHEEGQMEVVTSQPWIDVHGIRPNPSVEEINEYMGRSGFEAASLNLDTPVYFHRFLGLVALDAHDRNILRDQAGELFAIDLVIGKPTEELKRSMDIFFSGPNLSS